MNYVTCACKHCGEYIEFDQDYNGLEIDCPHCGSKTSLSDAPAFTPLVSQPSALTSCPDCSHQVSRRAVTCPHCGAPLAPPIAPPAPPPQIVYAAPPQYAPPAKSRAVYIILGLLVGALGVHNFYAGHVGRGLIQLAVTLTIGWSLILPLIAIWIWNLFEIFLTSEDGQGRAMA